MTIKIHITTDNGKTGIPAFNLLPGTRETYSGCMPKKYRNDPEYQAAAGTCSQNCPGCYAMTVTRYDNVFKAYFNNTMMVKLGKYDDLRAQLSAWLDLFQPRYFRLHDSGDFDNLEYFKMWVEIIKDHPETTFYCYTKETEILRAAGFDTYEKLKKALPNFTVLLSYWPGVCEDMLPGYPRFDYDENKNMKCGHCPAVDINGKRTGIMCIQCKRCPQAAAGSIAAVYPHK